MAPKPSKVLGAYEWERHGGRVEVTDHPGGRYTVHYVSREKHKFRSWKQCLQWITSQLPPNLGKQCHRGSKRPFLETQAEEPQAEKKKRRGADGKCPPERGEVIDTLDVSSHQSATDVASGSGSRVPSASNTEGQRRDKPFRSVQRERSKRHRRPTQYYDSMAAQRTQPESSTSVKNLDHDKGTRSASRGVALDDGLAHEKEKAAVPRKEMRSSSELERNNCGAEGTCSEHNPLDPSHA